MKSLFFVLILFASAFADASSLSVKEKKQIFLNLLVPAVDEVYLELQNQYDEIKVMIDKDENNPKINRLMKSYSAKDKQDLLVRIKPHPKSVAIAQAAMESGWATSRFTKVANNIFGVWSFNKNEPRVPASQKRGSKTIYIKKYSTISDSIRDYYKVLASGKAFKEFRKQKMISDNPYELVKRLDKYSEKGAEYGKELAAMIKYNKFYRIDNK
ncbi:MAG: glucosaminidase domain-containing protein [Campylobacterota bacterium]|nr:glucosaminidase domain-containing protein [Campylobacterota bacterium]